MIDTQVGAYRVLQQIGKGGMGTVWLAEHVMLGRRAAIKLLHPMYTARPDIVTRFFNEARAATAISDPGIVQIFDFGHHSDGTAYIAMEMLDGEPLDRRVRRLGKLALGDALRIVRQVASTLGVAHARGIIHRDLKPENVFLVHDPEVAGGERAKILDFGIAKLTLDPSNTTDSAVMGTPTYMSPEQCRGAGQVDQRSDVYALGCLLFALITGGPPFQSAGPGDVIAMHLREPPPPPSSRARGVPAAVDALVARCLEKDPARRFASGAELAAAIGRLTGVATGSSISFATDLTPALAGAGGESTTLSSANGATDPSARRRSRSIAFAALGALLVGGGVTAAVMSRGRSAGPAVAAPLPPIAASPPPIAAPPPPPAASPPPPAPSPSTAVAPASPPAEPSPSPVAPSPSPVAPSPSPVVAPPAAERPARNADGPTENTDRPAQKVGSQKAAGSQAASTPKLSPSTSTPVPKLERARPDPAPSRAEAPSRARKPRPADVPPAAPETAPPKPAPASNPTKTPFDDILRLPNKGQSS